METSHSDSMHDSQGHSHGGMSELLEHRSVPLGRLYVSIAITVAGMVVEIIGGVFTGSLALLSDAGHMFTHVFALGISALAVRLARSEPCHHRIFGLLRAEVLAAYTNAVFLFGVTAFSAAVVLRSYASGTDAQEIRGNLAERLRSHFGFTETTIEVCTAANRSGKAP